MKELNDYLDEIEKPKPFEEQIKSLKKIENLEGYYFTNDFDDKEESKSKIFKLKLAHLSNIIDKKLFEKIFGHTLIKSADKLINTINKEENQIIINNINRNKDNLFEKDEFNDWEIQSSDQRINLKDAIDLILDFNEELN